MRKSYGIEAHVLPAGGISSRRTWVAQGNGVWGTYQRDSDGFTDITIMEFVRGRIAIRLFLRKRSTVKCFGESVCSANYVL